MTFFKYFIRAEAKHPIHTNNVTDMNWMFNGCSSLKELNLNNFNTNNVTNMGNMFYGCSSLTNINLSNFNTNNVTDMAFMFDGCASLTKNNIIAKDRKIPNIFLKSNNIKTKKSE